MDYFSVPIGNVLSSKSRAVVVDLKAIAEATQNHNYMRLNWNLAESSALGIACTLR